MLWRFINSYAGPSTGAILVGVQVSDDLLRPRKQDAQLKIAKEGVVRKIGA